MIAEPHMVNVWSMGSITVEPLWVSTLLAASVDYLTYAPGCIVNCVRGVQRTAANQ